MLDNIENNSKFKTNYLDVKNLSERSDSPNLPKPKRFYNKYPIYRAPF